MLSCYGCDGKVTLQFGFFIDDLIKLRLGKIQNVKSFKRLKRITCYRKLNNSYVLFTDRHRRACRYDKSKGCG